MNVSIIGATGYVGLELTRLLSCHPNVTLKHLVSQNFVGKKFSDIYPSMRGICDIICSDMDIEKISKESDLVVTALPHGISKDVIPHLINAGVKVIDHSGDFRYRDINTYEKWYKTTHSMPELNKIAVYGLPEIYREQIKNAQLVGNPGCYPTCSILPLVPLIKKGIIRTDGIIIDATSGVSGAGRKSDLPFSFCEVDNNFKAYGVTNHRHTSEIEQELSIAAGKEILISFTPHLAPFKRGMLATTYANLNENISTSEILNVLSEYYKAEKFVRVLSECESPEVKNVAGSNYLDIGAVVDERLNRVVLISAQDNLLKGAAGQAIQVLNIMCGFDESAGLGNVPLYL